MFSHHIQEAGRNAPNGYQPAERISFYKKSAAFLFGKQRF
jgi:hypothetical protein